MPECIYSQNNVSFRFPYSLDAMFYFLRSRQMEDLRGRLTLSVLPDLPIDHEIVFLSRPPSGHKSHLNHLSVRSEPWRRLEKIYRLSMTNQIATWVDAVFLNISNVCEPQPLISETLLQETLQTPENLTHILQWIEKVPLVNVQFVLQFLYPSTRTWAFFKEPEIHGNPSNGDLRSSDSSIFGYFKWAPIAELQSQGSVIIAVQPWWILSDEDIKELVTPDSFPACYGHGQVFPQPLRSKFRVWAKLWDTCALQGSHWFALTNYKKWVFGVFSPGYSVAFVSQVFDHDKVGPSIVECLTFWVASAMGLPSTFEKTRVPEPISYLTEPPQLLDDEAMEYSIPPTESNWNGKNDEIASTSNSLSTTYPVSENGLEDRNRKGSDIINKYISIKRWLHGAPQSGFTPLPAIIISKSRSKPHYLHRIQAEKKNSSMGEWLAEA